MKAKAPPGGVSTAPAPLQTDKDRTSGPEGATGLHRIAAKVA